MTCAPYRYCHSGPDAPDLATAVKLIKPSVLVGLTSGGTTGDSTSVNRPFTFTAEMLQVRGPRPCGVDLFPMLAPKSQMNFGCFNMVKDQLLGATWPQWCFPRCVLHGSGCACSRACNARACLPAWRGIALQTMAANCKAPLVFPLSPSAPECSAEDAYRWTDGRAVIATGQRVRQAGRREPGQGCERLIAFPMHAHAASAQRRQGVQGSMQRNTMHTVSAPRRDRGQAAADDSCPHSPCSQAGTPPGRPFWQLRAP